ncbi:Mu-like prophage FluMu G protein 2 [Thalassotalea loyana]|uniref:Mu-like prophage FluMu G protein 2 n=1 Tax=Thalassotalea loyana TaxID=280483 RepID=A0ABQ6HBT2_9GAMM|nr:phage virion morphogenesis protein [Thalassotalea loyana]GLX85057.1 Mu-like prophage FluMu G protein 2 [Thalassotalea loyana]
MEKNFYDDGLYKLFNQAISFGNEQGRPVLKTIGQAMVNDFRTGFKRGVAPDGSKWAPLKIRKGQPLRDTGRLQQSINSQLSPAVVEVGTNVFYAPFHHHGAVIKPKKPGGKLKFSAAGRVFFLKKAVLPARPFIGYGQRQEKKLSNAVNSFVKALIAND